MENAPTLEEKITRQPLHLTIPKFSIDSNVDLIENLRQQVKNPKNIRDNESSYRGLRLFSQMTLIFHQLLEKNLANMSL